VALQAAALALSYIGTDAGGSAWLLASCVFLLLDVMCRCDNLPGSECIAVAAEGLWSLTVC
jgi:hypothetical protein